jgi:hypothetical protein
MTGALLANSLFAKTKVQIDVQKAWRRGCRPDRLISDLTASTFEAQASFSFVGSLAKTQAANVGFAAASGSKQPEIARTPGMALSSLVARNRLYVRRV